MADTPLVYYTSESNYGNYQFSTLAFLIDKMILEKESDPDSFIKNKPRELFISNAKDGIKEMTIDMANDVLALELEIGDDLQFIYPQDYLNWVRVSLVGENGCLQVLDENRCSNTAKTYLQDHEFNILFDSNGDPLEADGNNVYNTPFVKQVIYDNTWGTHFQKDTSKLSRYGEFTADKRRGVFTFSSNLSGKNIVIEYLSDGLQWDDLRGEEITIHKFFEQPIKNWVYWKLIEHGKSVPEREKARAERTFNGSRQLAYSRTANIKLQAVSRAFRKSLKWIKT